MEPTLVTVRVGATLGWLTSAISPWLYTLQTTGTLRLLSSPPLASEATSH